MTLLSTILAFFPMLAILLASVAFLGICIAPGVVTVGLFLFSLYGFPLVIYRIHDYFHPVSEGISYLKVKAYSPWWGSHQIQAIYIAFPALEGLLRLIPGLFSVWLRLWGSKIGKSVYWTPQIQIADRGLLEIGDRVIFGYGVGLYSHVIKPRKQDLMLYVKRIKIGNDVFVGAGSNLAPGAAIAPGTYIPILTNIYPNQKMGKPNI